MNNKFKINRDNLYSTGLNSQSMYEVTADNIADIEAACKAFKDDANKPKDILHCQIILNCMSPEQFYCLSEDTDENKFPEAWNVSKLSAIALIEQVWIALHDGDFNWLKITGRSHHFRFDAVCDEVQIHSHESGNRPSQFPFKTKELAEQARAILTDKLIKESFKAE